MKGRFSGPDGPATRTRLGLVDGFTAVPRALAVLATTRGTKRHVLIPIVINVAVGGLLTWLAYIWVLRAIGPTTAAADNLAGEIIRALVVIAAVLVSGFLITRFGVLLGSPFYNQLAETIERRRLGNVPQEPFTLANIAGDLWRAVRFEVTKSGLALLASLGIVLIGLLPVLGQLAGPVLGFAVAVWVACMDFFDPSLDRRRLSFAEKNAYVFSRAPGSWAFGAVAALCSMVPVANLFLVPICVAAGTLVYCQAPLPVEGPGPRPGEGAAERGAGKPAGA